jgi:hypothetical protein
MRQDERKDRLSEAAAARAAASEGAALSVAAGSMVLGIMQSEPVQAARQQAERDRTPDAAAPTSDTTVAPASVVPVAASTTEQAMAGSDRAVPANEAGLVTPQPATNATGPLPHTADPPTDSPGGIVGMTSLDPPGAAAASVSTQPAASDEPAPIWNGLNTDLGSAMSDLQTVADEMSATLQTAMTDLRIDLSEMTGSLSQTFDAMAEGIPALTGGASGMASFDMASLDMPVLSWSAIDGAAQGDATVLAGLPQPLLGAHSVPQADGIMVQNFGIAPTVPPLDDAPFSMDAASAPPIGFVGLSYIDAIDPQETGSHSMNSPMHGLI